MAYKILPYTKRQAKKLKVRVVSSTKANKKIDVYQDGKKVASIGAMGYKDYPTYMKLEQQGKVNKGVAKKRRAAYKKRHQNNRTIRGTPGYYADNLLW